MLELIEALPATASSTPSPASRSSATAWPCTTRCASALADLDELPFPDLRLLVGNEKLTTMPIMTSWGCPFDCNFCSVTAMFGKQVPLPQRRERGRRAQGQAPAAHLLLRRQLGRQQEAAQEAAADDDRRGPRDPLVGAGAHRRGARPASCSTSCAARAASSSTSASSPSTRRRSTASRSRRRWTTSRTAIKVLHEYGINSHGMFVLGADNDDVQTVRDTVTFAIENHIDTVMLNILTPLPGHAAVRGARRRRAASSTSAGSSTTRTTSSSSRAHDARTSCRSRSCAATCASTPCAPGCATSSRFQFTKQLLFHGGAW